MGYNFPITLCYIFTICVYLLTNMFLHLLVLRCFLFVLLFQVWFFLKWLAIPSYMLIFVPEVPCPIKYQISLLAQRRFESKGICVGLLIFLVLTVFKKKKKVLYECDCWQFYLLICWVWMPLFFTGNHQPFSTVPCFPTHLLSTVEVHRQLSCPRSPRWYLVCIERCFKGVNPLSMQPQLITL